MEKRESITIGNVTNIGILENLEFPVDAVYEPSMPEGQREGKVTVYSKDGIRIALLNYKNNKLNGVCKYFDNATLIKEISFVNGKMEGWSREENKEFIYHANVREYELVKNQKLEGYVDEININTKKVNRCYIIDANHKPTGVGYLYKDGVVNRIVNFVGDEEIVVKEFDEFDNKMIEKDGNGNVVYEGGYLKDEKMWFPRHGSGKEIKGNEVYIGNWQNNQKEGQGKLLVNGCLRYEGMWKNDIAHGKGRLYDDEYNMVCEGEWREGVCEKNNKEYYYCDIDRGRGGCFGIERKKVRKL